jgi:AcrR family transcriptional regulator
MAEIARQCGLQQPSLYYYFRSKGELLDEIAAEANRAPLQLVARVRDGGGSSAVQLYRIIARRGGVVRPSVRPERDPPARRADRATFARYWTSGRAPRRRTGCHHPRRGRPSELRSVDPRLTALTLMSNDEGTQNWLRVAGRDGEPVHASVAEHHAVGSFLADLAVRGLLAAPRDLDRVRRAADALDAAAAVA